MSGLLSSELSRNPNGLLVNSTRFLQVCDLLRKSADRLRVQYLFTE